MEQNKRKDPELVKVIDDAIASTTTYVAALDKLIEWEKKNRGLIGMHLSTYSEDNPNNETIARDILLMHRACAEGNYRDATNNQL